VSANKAVVVDTNKDITGFGNITMNGDLTMDVGNLLVKRNILGTKGNATIERNLTVKNDFRVIPDGFTLEWGTGTRTLIPPFHFAVGTYNNNGWLLMANDNSEGIWLATSGNIGINTKSPSYRLDVDGSFNSTSFYLNGSQMTATAAELNYLDFSSGYTLGVCESSKAVVLDSSRNTSNINSLIATSLTGTLQTASQPNITSVGTLTGLNVNAAATINEIVVGNSNQNLLRFFGTTSDTGGYHTVLSERIYGGTEQAELLIFKGNDPATASGPDRIRLRGAEFVFQTYYC
jgi:hypothetical protein